jgi:hypothetical protein
MHRSSASDGKRMRVALWVRLFELWVRLFALWVFHLHCGCHMKNAETWVDAIWKNCSKDSSDARVGERKIAVPI